MWWRVQNHAKSSPRENYQVFGRVACNLKTILLLCTQSQFNSQFSDILLTLKELKITGYLLQNTKLTMTLKTGREREDVKFSAQKNQPPIFEKRQI